MQDLTIPQNFFAIAYKPPNISSLTFANALKRGFKQLGFPIKKIGFSGTLDPFAHGMLILGINGCTKLLPHIKKDYKTYRAVLFLGLESKSLDTENVIKIHKVKPYSYAEIYKAVEGIKGVISYKPPKFSAKHINGVRAYELMRKGVDFDMHTITTEVKTIEILNYSHPFLSFEVCVSEGGYIRSIGDIIAKNLGVYGGLCSLERLEEGQWNYHTMLKSYTTNKQTDILDCIEVPLQIQGIEQNAKVILLDMKNALKYDTIRLTEYAKVAYNGAKFILNPSLCAEIFGDIIHIEKIDSDLLKHDYIQQSQNIQATHLELGCHNKEVCPDTIHKKSVSKIVLADFDTHFGIIEVFQDGRVKYILNRIDKC
ncbi:pseudouridine synthase family protein [Helicobacter trogontum]|uniref:tRNA pseudouridine(55) synthase TruB n=1 Tax=Helicobacter trogontum TaxID=50960 RepID=UPI00068D77C2|nr:tRNA pseudouridine(55) synthase TruB [Helicobacter trogontum]